ncbi:hypothetical protein V5799_025788 [Amblyomma americanum]|uniref:Uncharacterized protein n=1 Tax=Amblyomma americanum TaxID=6943 RepID=A0AAQ4E891_AMBAM
MGGCPFFLGVVCAGAVAGAGGPWIPRASCEEFVQNKTCSRYIAFCVLFALARALWVCSCAKTCYPKLSTFQLTAAFEKEGSVFCTPLDVIAKKILYRQHYWMLLMYPPYLRPAPTKSRNNSSIKKRKREDSPVGTVHSSEPGPSGVTAVEAVELYLAASESSDAAIPVPVRQTAGQHVEDADWPRRFTGVCFPSAAASAASASSVDPKTPCCEAATVVSRCNANAYLV